MPSVKQSAFHALFFHSVYHVGILYKNNYDYYYYHK